MAPREPEVAAIVPGTAKAIDLMRGVERAAKLDVMRLTPLELAVEVLVAPRRPCAVLPDTEVIERPEVPGAYAELEGRYPAFSSGSRAQAFEGA